MGRTRKITETISSVVSSTKQFIWQGPRRADERDGSGNLVRKFYNRGFEQAGSKHFYSRDLLGSTMELCDNSGNIESQYSYDLFGRFIIPSSSTRADFTYAGNYVHERSQLLLANYRAYNAAFARFMNRDPIEETGGVNLYSYVRNDPVSQIDPNGLKTNQPTKYWTNEVFSDKAGVPGNVIKQGGCIAVVRAKLGMSGMGLPEGGGNIPSGTDCYWGDGQDTDAAINKCMKKQCPPNTHLVIWCKQGHLKDGQNPGPPGSTVSDPGGVWNSGADKDGYFNYAIYNPDNATYYGANTDGGCGYTSGSMQGASAGMNGTMCCASCVGN